MWTSRNRKRRSTGDPLRDLPEWQEEFEEILVDDSVPEHRDASSSSHELPSEPRAKVVSGKLSISTHFPTDRNCDICLRTKITRASCRRRAGTVVPRAENFGDSITADHKILSERSGSRNNHRYAVVVQDLATLRIQSYPCNTKTSQETEKNLQKFLEPTRKPKVVYTDNSLEFGKSCEDHGIAERAVRRIKEETSPVLLQIRSGQRMVGGFHGVLLLSANHSRFMSYGKTPYERRFGTSFNGPVCPFGAMRLERW